MTQALGPRHRQAFLPSLLDRLLDDTSSRRAERPDAYAPQADGMLQIVKRDLGWLLNTTNLGDELNATLHAAAASSVINYGIPELSGAYLRALDWEAVEKRLRAAIICFEPRLIPDSLRIVPVGGSEAEMRHNKLAFEIRGLVKWSPYPLEFNVRSLFDAETNGIAFDADTDMKN
ncbi:type VI secretion system baseplate subunit TssE [Burkholderia sp. JSH-S8]|nr:type VI secretion system baseplate subunit TssE [Burkholderia sp. JSH-S8]